MQDIKIAIDTAGTWPPTACKQNPGTWCLMSEEHMDYFLGVLPPIYFAGGFAVSEPLWDTAENVPVYLCIVKTPRGYVGRECTLKDAAADARILRGLADASATYYQNWRPVAPEEGTSI